VGICVCYVDESGDTRPLPVGNKTITPVCVIAGIAVEQAALSNLTREFLELKCNWFPNQMPRGTRRLSRMLVEIKGADLRRAMRDGAKRRNRRHALGFLDAFVTLLEDFDAQLIGRIWVKAPGKSIAETALYTSSLQAICAYFQHHLEASESEGIVIADSRTPGKNTEVSHSVFTQKFKYAGDEYSRILEMPTFGHSDNHAGIQIADLLCSALLFPMATSAFCTGYINSVHVQGDFEILRRRFGARLSKLQYRYRDENGRYRGGITVDDRLGQRRGGQLFRVSSPEPASAVARAS
jgi:uncharacterized protein DUF3800